VSIRRGENQHLVVGIRNEKVKLMYETVGKVSGDRINVLRAKNVFAEWPTIDDRWVIRGQTTTEKWV
jgi:hypothetical protein